MADYLPMFPLQLVVFPNEDLNLHIFEPRYKQLIEECDQQGLTFGIPAYIEGQLKDVGTEVRLVEIVKKYPSGESDVRTQGVDPFRIHEYHKTAPGKLYAGAEITRIKNQMQGDYAKNQELRDLVEELFKIMKINKSVPELDEQFRTYEVAHNVGLSLEQEYELLTIASETERQDYLINHLQNLIPTVKEMENLRQRVQMNGHFKNIIPPKL